MIDAVLTTLPSPVPLPKAETAPPAVALDAPAEPEPPPASPPPEAAPIAPPKQIAASTPPVSPFAGRDVADLARAVAATATPTSEHAPSRVRRLGRVAPPPGTDFAYYLASWRRKVERVGQLNYPREARAQGIVGSLRLLVTIMPDGALDDVRVLETSGHPLLDDAALRIVRLAAPYAPFPPTMRATTDVLEIERTWRFLNSRLSS